MNAQTSAVDFSALLNASVQEQMKIQTAVKDARKALDEANSFNAARKAAASVLVSKIQADLNKQLVDTQKAQREAYEKSMVALGMSAQVFPLETAALYVTKQATLVDNKVVTPVLNHVGGFFGGIKDRLTGKKTPDSK